MVHEAKPEIQNRQLTYNWYALLILENDSRLEISINSLFYLGFSLEKTEREYISETVSYFSFLVFLPIADHSCQ